MQETALNILIADDEKDFASALAHMLAKIGHQVTAVSNGQEAKASIDVRDYDIVISDLMMPELDGAELLLWFKEMKKQPYFVILSGYYNDSFVKYFRQIGVDQVLGKPISLQGLEEIIANARLKQRQFQLTGTYVVPAPVAEERNDPVASSGTEPDIISSSSLIEKYWNQFDGIIAMALIDTLQGKIIGEKKTDVHITFFDLSAQVMHIMELYKELQKYIGANPSAQTDDQFIVTTNYYHLAMPIADHLILYLIVQKDTANLGLARLTLHTIANDSTLTIAHAL